jgi:hypothetical protein
MLELTKSAISYSWAMSLFGSQQLANLVAPADRRDPTRRAAAAFYSVTQATQNQFDDLVFASFQIGDEVQRGLVDLAFDTLTLRAFAPSYVSRLTSDIGEQSRDTLRVFTSAANARLAWQELKNNYEVFNLVKNSSSLLNLPAEGKDFDLSEAIRKAYELGGYPDLWAVEGLGHDYALTFFPLWGKSQRVRGILTDGQAAALPDKSLTMMHAGLGLAFAEKLMDRITPYSRACDIRGLLQEFVTLVKDNARNGYEGAAYESLGLVTRFWHSQMVNIVGERMGEVEPAAVSYFWHGVGRAYYFLPIYFVPGLLSPWAAVERDAPHELAWLNMTAGLAWAMAIVNVRQPQIMENFLKNQGEQFARTPAFSDGVMSALIMGIDITPGDVYIAGFLQYTPDSRDKKTAELWNRLVGRPGSLAVNHYHPVLRKHRRLGEVFRYQDLSELVARLDGGRRAARVAA